MSTGLFRWCQSLATCAGGDLWARRDTGRPRSSSPVSSRHGGSTVGVHVERNLSVCVCVCVCGCGCVGGCVCVCVWVCGCVCVRVRVWVGYVCVYIYIHIYIYYTCNTDCGLVSKLRCWYCAVLLQVRNRAPKVLCDSCEIYASHRNPPSRLQCRCLTDHGGP